MCFFQILEHETILWKAHHLKITVTFFCTSKQNFRAPGNFRNPLGLFLTNISPTQGTFLQCRFRFSRWGPRFCISCNDGDAVGPQIMLWEEDYPLIPVNTYESRMPVLHSIRPPSSIRSQVFWQQVCGPIDTWIQILLSFWQEISPSWLQRGKAFLLIFP